MTITGTDRYVLTSYFHTETIVEKRKNSNIIKKILDKII